MAASFSHNLDGRSRHLFDNDSTRRGGVERPVTEDDNPLVAVRPLRICQNCFESLAAYHKRIDACYELVVTVGFAPPGGKQSRSLFGRAMNPSTLVRMKADTVTVPSSSVMRIGRVVSWVVFGGARAEEWLGREDSNLHHPH